MSSFSRSAFERVGLVYFTVVLGEKAYRLFKHQRHHYLKKAFVAAAKRREEALEQAHLQFEMFLWNERTEQTIKQYVRLKALRDELPRVAPGDDVEAVATDYIKSTLHYYAEQRLSEPQRRECERFARQLNPEQAEWDAKKLSEQLASMREMLSDVGINMEELDRQLQG